MKAYTIMLKTGSCPLGLHASDEAAIAAATKALARYAGRELGED